MEARQRLWLEGANESGKLAATGSQFKGLEFPQTFELLVLRAV